MTHPSDPPRLVESAESPTVRRLMMDSQSDIATDAELTQLESRLAPLLWLTGPVSAPLSKPALLSHVTGAAAVKVGIVVGAAVAAGSLLVSTTRHPDPPRVVAPAAAHVDEPPPAAAPPAAEATPVVPAAPADAPADDAANEPPAKRKLLAQKASEADLLDRARRALASDPGHALALAEQHRRTFSRGILVQEREVIAVEALAKLGRAGEARARADRFLRAFPGSAYRSKLESSVAPK